MERRISAWAVSDAMGKPRRDMRAEWVRWGLLRPPGADGRWDADELPRLAHARALESEGRRLSRRAILLQRDGYPVDVGIRRRAMADVLTRLTRARHKTAQVLWELRAMGDRYQGPGPSQPVLLGLEVPPERLAEVLTVASDGLVDHWYQVVDMQARAMPAVGRAKQIPICDEVPFEERISLVMCQQLLDENYVRNRLRLLARAPRYGPSAACGKRSAGAPLLRGQHPPPRGRER